MTKPVASQPDLRVFLSQAHLDERMELGTVELEGDRIVFPSSDRWVGGQSLHIETAIYIVREVTEEGDPAKLVGRVKTLAAIEALGGEYCEGSLILGDAAFDAVEGFLVAKEGASAAARSSKKPGLSRGTPTGPLRDDGDEDAAKPYDELAKLFMGDG